MTSFKKLVKKELKDRYLRANFRWVIDDLVERRRKAFPDQDELEFLRDLGHSIRLRALNKLPELLLELESNCKKNGIQVHWAETVEQANEIVLNVMKDHKATQMIKGKSMVSEEMHLNHFLEKHGIQSLESDLGEYIIQLAEEKPYHIIAPAIHKDRIQIAKLFEKKIADCKYTDQAEELTIIARNKLRQKFYEAEVGLSGVNFAVAETGSLCLVENEGNGRLCTTLPPVHIAVMGLEKVVEKFQDVPPLLSLLTRSATGQAITAYFNIITSVRKANEKDGPKEVHLIILDNGRSRLLTDPELRETLLCIRCGSCLNHCPVYIAIGGHGYGSVYPGPIGKIFTAQIEGIKEAGELPVASSLCGACTEVCPVKIPITEILLRLRNESIQKKHPSTVLGHGSRRNFLESIAVKIWKWINCSPRVHRLLSNLAAKFLTNVSLAHGPMKKWAHFRVPPKLAPKTFQEIVKEKGLNDE